jgi:hypothetical protein
LFGLIYWYAVLPLHGVVFRGMLAGIRSDAMRIALMPRSQMPLDPRVEIGPELR